MLTLYRQGGGTLLVKDFPSSSSRIRFPIGAKLAAIIGLVVLISLGTVTILNSYFIGEDVRIAAENSNLSANTRAAGAVNDKLGAIRSNVFQLLDMLFVTGGRQNGDIARLAQAFFFERNSDIAAIFIISEVGGASCLRIENSGFFIAHEIERGVLDSMLALNAETVARSCRGEIVAKNISPFFLIPAMALFFPWKENGVSQACVVAFSIESLSDILGADSSGTTFLINDSDELLSHPDTDRILAGQSLMNSPLVVSMRAAGQSAAGSRQIPYIDYEGGRKARFFGAYQKLLFADIVCLTAVSLDSVLEGVRATRKNTIFLTGVVFFLSVAVILVFSRYAISLHLKKLAAAAAEISAGNFETRIIDTLNVSRRDEIGVLNRSVKDEREFLNTFAKFTNRNVAKAIATKSIDFRPNPKDVTIFFSDIRGFTAISDGFKARFGNGSAGEIIGFLNDYMGRMVECVALSGGSIDKFEGDAIMAVWGILRDDSLAFESLADGVEKERLSAEHRAHVREDAVNALTGAVAMRYALMKYNKDAEAFTKAHEGEENAQYKPHIRIGCGLNTGRASVGLMGSKDKMEYTSIGDAVNFASRTEASNKPCGTDILISEDTYNLLKEKYIRCPENNFTLRPEDERHEIVVEMIPVEFEVKGKGAQHFYGVVNLPQFDIEEFFSRGGAEFSLDADCARACGRDGPRTLNEVRALLGIPVPDFGKVNLNEEENKISVKNER